VTFEDEWARCEPWISAALEHAGRTHTLDDVRETIARGDGQLWAGADCALVTTIETSPTRKTLLLWLAGGDISELINEWRAEAESWGREMGCTMSMVIGRRGWVKALQPHGYAPQACILTKDL
jgi:hypothetical protein